MWTEAVACASYLANFIALFDLISYFDIKRLEVIVSCGISLIVLNLNIVPFFPIVLSCKHRSCLWCIDWRPLICTYINPHVMLLDFLLWMHAHTKGRSNFFLARLDGPRVGRLKRDHLNI